MYFTIMEMIEWNEHFFVGLGEDITSSQECNFHQS